MPIYSKQLQNLTIHENTGFISDIHLDASSSIQTKLFLDFMEFADKNIETLFILGDLFEYWIGDDDNSEYANAICTALRRYSNHHRLFFMRGNRDFIVGKRFCRRTGATLLADYQTIDLQGKKTLLMHGDLLCTLDQNYLKARRFYTHPLTKTILNLLPISYRLQKANKLREKSKRHYHSANEMILDVHQPTVEAIMRQHNVSCLIHGHTHRPNVHHFKIGDHEAERWVLGDWYECGNMIVFKEGKLTYHDFEKVEALKQSLKI